MPQLSEEHESRTIKATTDGANFISLSPSIWQLQSQRSASGFRKITKEQIAIELD